MLEAVFLCFFFLSLSSNFKNGSKPFTFWKSSYPLILLLILPEISVIDAIPPLEVQAKLKEKIRKGKLVVEELNELLDHVKKNVKEGLNVEKEVLNELVDIKDKFKKLELDPGDLPVDLIEKFKEKVLEAFGIILASYKLDKIKEAKDQEYVEQFQEKVVNKVKKEFKRHMEKEL